MHWVKKHGKVLAACDEGIIGMTFKEGEATLRVSESFYKGSLVTKQELSELLSEYSNINLVGEETIKTAEEKNMISRVIRIEKTPYAVIFKI